MNRLIGLILITPLVWVALSGMSMAIFNDSSKDGVRASSFLGFFITLALWGVIVLLGWV